MDTLWLRGLRWRCHAGHVFAGGAVRHVADAGGSQRSSRSPQRRPFSWVAENSLVWAAGSKFWISAKSPDLEALPPQTRQMRPHLPKWVQKLQHDERCPINVSSICVFIHVSGLARKTFLWADVIICFSKNHFIIRFNSMSSLRLIKETRATYFQDNIEYFLSYFFV